MVIGETKLGYKITELLGQGGFGTVYKAVKKNKAMETVRALKHISLPSRKQWTDIYNSMGNDVARTDEYFDTILQEILNEIRILADLTSKGVKNVVWYYENEIEDTPSPKHYDIYLLMEYLTALPSYIETHEFKVKDVIKVGTDILSALIECHKRKIIHRDIKTDNIFISEEGDYKLGDFGVSKKLSDRSRATSMKGTPNYIAPEVYLGEAYDETVDLYSLGIVLYRLLNYNRNPFMPDYPNSYTSEDEDKAFELRMKGEMPSYPAFASGELGDVILKSISNKENRFQSAEEFKYALEMVASSLSAEELETVVLENVLSNVDLSTFGSDNNVTQMASDSISAPQNKSDSNSQSNSFVQNSINNSVSTNPNVKKNSMLLPIAAIVAIVVIAAGAFFVLRGGKAGSDGKFVQVDGYSKFLKKNGEYAQNEWVFFNGSEYYFNGRQSLVTNSAVDYNGKTYYVNSDGAKVVDGWYRTQDGKEYYLDSNGDPYKNTAKIINGETAFFNNNGERVTNDWASFDGNYYFVDSEGVLLKNTFKNLGLNEWYYLGSDGKMLSNTFSDIDGKTYYFGSDGKMAIASLVQVANDVFYADADGSIKRNAWVVNNQYYVGSDGKILKNTTTPDGVEVDSTGRGVQAQVVNETRNSSSGNSSNQNSSLTADKVSTSGGTGGSTGGSGTAAAGTTITNGNVAWGEHLKYEESVNLEEYGENGGIGKIRIDVRKLKDDGTEEVANVNVVLKQIFDDVVQRAETELPFKSFDCKETSLSTSNDTMLVIVVTGKIQYMDNTTYNMRYKLVSDRNGTVTFEKVR